MLDSFRGEAFVRECPEGAVEVERGEIPAGVKFLYQSADSNNVPAVYSVKPFDKGGISVLKDGFKYKRISPMKPGRELMTDRELLEGCEAGTYHTDPIAVPLGLMRVRGALVEWNALDALAEKIDKEGGRAPISPVALLKYSRLGFYGDSVASSVYKLEDVNFDVRFSELIMKLISKLRKWGRAEILLISEMLIDFFVNLNKSRGANARLMYELGIYPSTEAMVCENYSIVSFEKDGRYGLFFHDHDSSTLQPKSEFGEDVDDYFKRLDCFSVPRVVLVLQLMKELPGVNFTAAHDFLTIDELTRNAGVSRVCARYRRTFLDGFNDCFNNLGSVDSGKLEFVRALLS